MGQTTPNIGIFIPAAGESNYDQSFLQGMVNIDQHDHSGGPNKGVPITTSGMADFSVTYKQLNSNVVDASTGIGVKSGSLANQLQILGLLKSLYQLATATGFLTKNGTVASARTFQNSSTVTWTNADGTGDPSAAVDPTGFPYPWTVPQGGSGQITFSRIGDVVTSGSTATGNFQQPTGTRNGTKLLQEQGISSVPAWKSLFDLGLMQTVYINLTASQLRALNTSPVTLVPAQGANTLIIPLSCAFKLVSDGTAFTSRQDALIVWNNTFDVPLVANPTLYAVPATLFAQTSSFYWTVYQNDSYTQSLDATTIENKPIVLYQIGNMANGGNSTAVVSLTYYVI